MRFQLGLDIAKHQGGNRVSREKRAGVQWEGNAVVDPLGVTESIDPAALRVVQAARFHQLCDICPRPLRALSACRLLLQRGEHVAVAGRLLLQVGDLPLADDRVRIVFDAVRQSLGKLAGLGVFPERVIVRIRHLSNRSRGK